MKTHSLTLTLAAVATAVSLLATPAHAGDRKYKNYYRDNNDCNRTYNNNYGYYQQRSYYQPVQYYRPAYCPPEPVYYQRQTVPFFSLFFGNGSCR